MTTATTATNEFQLLEVLEERLADGEPFWLAIEWGFEVAGFGVDRAMELLQANGGITKARVSDVLAAVSMPRGAVDHVRVAEDEGELLSGLRRARQTLRGAGSV